ncbi:MULTISPECIES: group II intron reverse transcriptase/maturase [Streptomyces]|uniref:RNA-directed DNA polymerase n=1 Tax=Streptomyces mirabilis TaxID=68239 RepID=A0ABU3V147_9ACTN|nr:MULTISPECIES: group II intron reverse transcriptase/maturase [Streptomyces]MCX4617177.1 group II intron reverse transcriptase/maturase [Streptomyces mirabilis]MCX4617291.1 group II intron reverse transcriptase/maturase [Streptomyces mirabilis]MCX5346754.1 group II intron reverse transcriptase/maturase [Streptomyces mirabilis]MCX5352843.1 group II intron reverse transcriptase/maturase [Streptomyces mirabilis]MCX5356149.1 group II intron reverse transcriptase/maturase [Streptomyces mirabilis]
MGQLKSKVKPFEISKWEIKEAWEEVKANKGAPGVDQQSIEDFEKDLSGNLYKVWNRMSSGSYFPPPVRAVEIPKTHGTGMRMLGIPAVSDRVAQTVVARYLVRRVDPVFHPDSYGYRPGRSALDAVEKCRERCWKRAWVVEFDIARFFDSVPWDLLVKAVEAHTDAVWVKLYVRRWLAAPLVMPDGSLRHRERGTPQGAPVSPVLANLFLHYAFDTWMDREFPAVQFERYADDAVMHCVTERQAREVLDALRNRMVEVGLELHPDKTRIVYCKDGKRRGSYEHEAFTFLGYTFRARKGRDRQGAQFLSFAPAVSKEALKRMGREVRSWRLHTRSDLSFVQLARRINPVVAGWVNYYGRFRPWELNPVLRRINAYLVRWIRRKYERLAPKRKAIAKFQEIAKRYPGMFAHWRVTMALWMV